MLLQKTKFFQNSENLKFIMNPSSKPISNGGAIPPPSLKIALNHLWIFTDIRTFCYFSKFDTFYLNLTSFRLFLKFYIFLHNFGVYGPIFKNFLVMEI